MQMKSCVRRVQVASVTFKVTSFCVTWANVAFIFFGVMGGANSASVSTGRSVRPCDTRTLLAAGGARGGSQAILVDLGVALVAMVALHTEGIAHEQLTVGAPRWYVEARLRKVVLARGRIALHRLPLGSAKERWVVDLTLLYVKRSDTDGARCAALTKLVSAVCPACQLSGQHSQLRTLQRVTPRAPSLSWPRHEER